MFTPSHVIKTAVERAGYSLPHRGRYGCIAKVALPDRMLAAQFFFGNDGRATRRRAEDWAHGEAERLARELATAWQDVRDSKRSRWGA